MQASPPGLAASASALAALFLGVVGFRFGGARAGARPTATASAAADADPQPSHRLKPPRMVTLFVLRPRPSTSCGIRKSRTSRRKVTKREK